MKKRFWMPLSLCMIMLFFMVVPVCVHAYEKESLLVNDSYGMLEESQEEELEAELQRISETYAFEGVLVISEDIPMDERKYADSYMQENEIGYGEEMNGMCILHQPDKRNITIVFRGPYQEKFTSEIQDAMLDCAVERLTEDDMYGAYAILLEKTENSLKRLEAGKKIRLMDVEEKGLVGFAVICLGISFLVSAFIVLVMTLVQNSRMKTKIGQNHADWYVPEDGVDFKQHRDIYLRTNTVKTKIEKNSSSKSSGSFHSGGESFSGSSRDY